MEFQPGQRVKLAVRGTLKIGNITIKDTTLSGPTIARRNPDGTYQVKGIINTPETDEVTIPAEWIEPL